MAQQRNEKAATPKDIQEAESRHASPSKHTVPAGALSVAAADPPPHSAAAHPPGHPDALPLSNSPRKENQFVDSPGNFNLNLHFTRMKVVED